MAEDKEIVKDAFDSGNIAWDVKRKFGTPRQTALFDDTPFEEK